MTVFSAPDYPQFQGVPESERYANLASVAILRHPDWATPEFHQYKAALRPEVPLFYSSRTHTLSRAPTP